MDELQDLINERQFERDWYVYDLNIEDLDSLKNLKEFTKWLVQNNKIDINKLMSTEWCPTNWWHREIEWYSNSERILMLSSIQDNPIEFLISILSF